MSENKLVGSLVLRTIDIDSTRVSPVTTLSEIFDNSFGTMAANGGVITWKNVNIRSCIGESYYKYNKFNLKLTAAQIRHTATALADAQFLIYISGLPFSSGSTYSTRFGPTNQSCIGAVNFVTGKHRVNEINSCQLSCENKPKLRQTRSCMESQAK